MNYMTLTAEGDLKKHDSRTCMKVENAWSNTYQVQNLIQHTPIENTHPEILIMNRIDAKLENAALRRIIAELEKKKTEEAGSNNGKESYSREVQMNTELISGIICLQDGENPAQL